MPLTSFCDHLLFLISHDDSGSKEASALSVNHSGLCSQAENPFLSLELFCSLKPPQASQIRYRFGGNAFASASTRASKTCKNAIGTYSHTFLLHLHTMSIRSTSLIVFLPGCRAKIDCCRCVVVVHTRIKCRLNGAFNAGVKTVYV